MPKAKNAEPGSVVAVVEGWEGTPGKSRATASKRKAADSPNTARAAKGRKKKKKK